MNKQEIIELIQRNQNAKFDLILHDDERNDEDLSNLRLKIVEIDDPEDPEDSESRIKIIKDWKEKEYHFKDVKCVKKRV